MEIDMAFAPRAARSTLKALSVVAPRQSELIAEAHNGPTEVIRTDGLGHVRILSDPQVLGAIARFAGAPLGDAVREPLVTDRL
jgi:hypothetical protein